MSKHTPGPWVHYMSGTIKAGLLRIAQVHGFHAESIYEQGLCCPLPVEANARLIAAAPELLARLDDCAHQLRQAWACIEHIKEHAPDYERKASIETLKAIQMVGNDAEAAIAKATGGKNE